MRWLHLLVCVKVWAYMNSEKLWVTVDFLLFEVHNQNWNREKKLRDHSCSFLFSRWQKHNHHHRSVFHLRSSAVIFNLQRSVFSLQRFVQLYCIIKPSKSAKEHTYNVCFLSTSGHSNETWVAVTTSSSLHSFNLTLVCRFLFSDRLSSSSRDPRGTRQRGHTLTH